MYYAHLLHEAWWSLGKQASGSGVKGHLPTSDPPSLHEMHNHFQSLRLRWKQIILILQTAYLPTKIFFKDATKSNKMRPSPALQAHTKKKKPKQLQVEKEGKVTFVRKEIGLLNEKLLFVGREMCRWFLLPEKEHFLLPLQNSIILLWFSGDERKNIS